MIFHFQMNVIWCNKKVEAKYLCVIKTQHFNWLKTFLLWLLSNGLKWKHILEWKNLQNLDFQIHTLLINDPFSVNRDSKMIYIATIARYAICITFRFSISPVLVCAGTMNPQNNCYRSFTFSIILMDPSTKTFLCREILLIF